MSFFFYGSADHQELHLPTHSIPTRLSSDRSPSPPPRTPHSSALPRRPAWQCLTSRWCGTTRTACSTCWSACRCHRRGLPLHDRHPMILRADKNRPLRRALRGLRHVVEESLQCLLMELGRASCRERVGQYV